MFQKKALALAALVLLVAPTTIFCGQGGRGGKGPAGDGRRGQDGSKPGG